MEFERGFYSLREAVEDFEERLERKTRELEKMTEKYNALVRRLVNVETRFVDWPREPEHVRQERYAHCKAKFIERVFAHATQQADVEPTLIGPSVRNRMALVILRPE